MTDVAGADVVHSHTWYANFAGHLASLLHGIPHIVTAHSLEPLRPWKAEQLGGGYAVSSWIEKTAYEGAAAIVAVSEGMRGDILRSYPALDPGEGARDLQRHRRRGVASRRGSGAARGARDRPGQPVGRLRRADHPAEGPAVPPARRRAAARRTCSSCCAPARPTRRRSWPRSKGSCAGCRRRARASSGSTGCCSRHELCTILSAATTFVCPSVYEPLGIVNLEAMACGAAVVGTATGGIPEVVVDGVTGRLVPIEQVQDGTGTPDRPRAVRERPRARAHRGRERSASAPRSTARAGRERATDDFSWERIAEQTAALYAEVAADGR